LGLKNPLNSHAGLFEKIGRVRFDDITNKISKELLKVLIDAGVIDQEESWIRERVGIPELTEEERKDIEEKKKQRVKDQQEMFPPSPDKENKSKFDENIKDREKDKGKMARTVGGFESPDPGDLSEKGARVLAAAYASCRKRWVKDHPGDRENKSNKASCAKQAWAAVKNAGYMQLQRGKNPFDEKKIRKTLDENEADFKKNYDKIYSDNIRHLLSLVQKKKILETKD